MARGSFGERLKRERELREVTLAEITSATRIAPRFLEALENEDWDKLPGGVFNRGFVRAVARYLGLAEEALLGEYDLAHGAQVQPPPERLDKRIPVAPRWFPVVVLLGTLVLLAGLIVGGIYAWRRYSANRAEKQVLTPMDLILSLSAPTHVRLIADDKLILDGDLPSAENRHFPATETFEVTAAVPSAVLLELNGQTMPPLGAPGASGTITLGRKDLRQASGGNSQP